MHTLDHLVIFLRTHVMKVVRYVCKCCPPIFLVQMPRNAAPSYDPPAEAQELNCRASGIGGCWKSLRVCVGGRAVFVVSHQLQGGGAGWNAAMCCGVSCVLLESRGHQLAGDENVLRGSACTVPESWYGWYSCATLWRCCKTKRMETKRSSILCAVYLQSDNRTDLCQL